MEKSDSRKGARQEMNSWGWCPRVKFLKSFQGTLLVEGDDSNLFLVENKGCKTTVETGSSIYSFYS